MVLCYCKSIRQCKESQPRKELSDSETMSAMYRFSSHMLSFKTLKQVIYFMSTEKSASMSVVERFFIAAGLFCFLLDILYIIDMSFLRIYFRPSGPTTTPGAGIVEAIAFILVLVLGFMNLIVGTTLILIKKYRATLQEGQQMNLSMFVSLGFGALSVLVWCFFGLFWELYKPWDVFLCTAPFSLITLIAAGLSLLKRDARGTLWQTKVGALLGMIALLLSLFIVLKEL
jgi:hypothetical protein